MSVMRNIFMHTFGRPQGVLGRLDGIIMARMNADCGAWVSDLLEVAPNDSVLEVGFGPGAPHIFDIDRARGTIKKYGERGNESLVR